MARVRSCARVTATTMSGYVSGLRGCKELIFAAYLPQTSVAPLPERGAVPSSDLLVLRCTHPPRPPCRMNTTLALFKLDSFQRRVSFSVSIPASVLL